LSTLFVSSSTIGGDCMLTYAAMIRLASSTWSLWWEASEVIALRSALLACGGTRGDAEKKRLIPEKIGALVDALLSLAADIALGRAHRSPQRTISMYRRRVRSNYRRLTRPT
jgi:hypothetical protein